MLIIVMGLVLVSHAFASRPFWSAMQRGTLPNTSDFAAISVILFYDIGLVFELLGYPYSNVFLPSLLTTEDSTFLLAMVLVAVAPWAFHAGSYFVSKRHPMQQQIPTLGISTGRRGWFYLFAILISVSVLAFGLYQNAQAANAWAVRAKIGEDLGPGIIILYVPLCILAFYVKQADSQGKRGLLFSLFLAVVAAASTVAIGERTLLLLPFLILALFRSRVSIAKLLLIAITLVVVAANLLLVIKWQYSGSETALDQLVIDTVYSDLSRASVLGAALEVSDPIGTHLLPYPMSGYVYSSLFFVPRTIAPFKGDSTTRYFTAFVARTNVAETNWGLGVGAIEEALLNAGIVLALPCLFLYGMIMGLLDKFSERVPSLTTAIRLGSIWLCGYGLPAILLLFGTMALVCLVFHYLFVKKRLVYEAPSRIGPEIEHALGSA